MQGIELTNALSVTGLLAHTAFICSKCLTDRKTAAISFIVGTALASLINFMAKRYRHKDIAFINLGGAMIVPCVLITFRCLSIDKFELIRYPLYWGQNGFLVVTTLVSWKIVIFK